MATGQYIYALALSGKNIFTGGEEPGGVHLSTNNGKNGTQSTYLNQQQYVISLAKLGKYIFVGTRGSSVWRRSFKEILK